MDGGEEVDGETVVAGGDASEVLQAAEHALDGVPVPIEIGREAVLPDPVHLGRDVRHRALRLDGATDAVAVVALVGVQDPALRKTFEQRRSRCAISDLATRQQEGDRPAEGIGQGVDLGRPPAA